MNIIKSILCSLLCLVTLACQATPSKVAEPTRIILSRHAEKEAGPNPNLNSKGRQRAEALKQLSQRYEIAGVISSNYKRTLQTTQPLANKLGLKIYSKIAPNNYPALLKYILTHFEGKTVFVAGHSNTVPAFINYILKEQLLPNLSETDFSKLYVVNINENEKTLKQYTQDIDSKGKLKLKLLKSNQ